MWNLYVLFICIVHIICIFLATKIEKFSLKLKIFSKNFLSEGQIFRSEGQFLGSNFSV
nr:MAG TPA: hypothetical protein [Bacteriophage sp.]